MNVNGRCFALELLLTGLGYDGEIVPLIDQKRQELKQVWKQSCLIWDILNSINREAGPHWDAQKTFRNL